LEHYPTQPLKLTKLIELQLWQKRISNHGHIGNTNIIKTLPPWQDLGFLKVSMMWKENYKKTRSKPWQDLTSMLLVVTQFKPALTVTPENSFSRKSFSNKGQTVNYI